MDDLLRDYGKLDDISELQNYIGHPADLNIDDLSKIQKHWNRTLNLQKLFDFDVSPLSTTLKVNRDLRTGSLKSFYEVEDDIGKSAKTSMSLGRAPGLHKENIRGNATNCPFLPGGMETAILEIPSLDGLDVSEIDFENELLTIPPGFDMGMEFDKCFASDETLSVDSKIDNRSILTTDLFTADDEDLVLVLENEKSATPEDNNLVLTPFVAVKENISSEKIASGGKVSRWAVVVDVSRPVDDFSIKVPVMAREWPFELDNFQKQAIIRLERHESVFVAAHTSAGKTVVAEYAIALSLKHMTRTIYTSPIKALSNQKFRDFKVSFQDVGLITGDVQIKPEAACLIMTTEILRSMLYNGSDIIRELEWVIFDEVHYINDKERGVVWEEVLILLPSHVNIVLLSATVPNTVEFAEWVGMTKQKKVYVISTLKRPVPLEHHLFTASDTKSQKDLYKIVDATNQFKIDGYNSARDIVKKKSESRVKKGVTTNYTTRNQERNIWISVLNTMKTLDQLPIIAFMFSRKLCDQNATMLTAVDLTTATEKNRIKEFTLKCLQNLKGNDSALPQVKLLQELLLRGIGLHHSGILPILKELVELLFQQGFVKLLFATETFAMGVNMPARTVIFDSITKYDGHQRRQLRPDEYIQMAGRAGRRGLDSTGMAAILCKNDIPERSALELMIQGKSTSLESRFRLTYGMILSLLRANQLRVEDMMKRSFSELGMQKNFNENERAAVTLQQKLMQQTSVDCNQCQTVIKDYYRTATLIVKLKNKNMKLLLTHSQGTKLLCVGRVVVVTTKLGATLGVIIKLINGRNAEPAFHVLIMCDQSEPGKKSDLSRNANERLWDHIWNVCRLNLYTPDDRYTNEVIRCVTEDFIFLTQYSIQIDGDKVMADWEKRQIPRFRDDPASQSFNFAAQQLMALLTSFDCEQMEVDSNIRDLDFCETVAQINKLKSQICNLPCCACAAFEEHLKTTCEQMILEDELESVRHKLSEESLIFLPQYKQRIQVLKRLGYIDDSMAVQLKGRVACEISNHELIITELVFNNILNQFQPSEIAAVLSCTVFQEKRRNGDECPELNEILQRGTEEIKSTIQRIYDIEKECGLCDDFEDQFNFNLTNVVYEWAKGMPFAEIMTLTETQEGVIVRCIQRLDEILRNVKDGARIIGDQVLFKKMDTASQAIKRDIVFAASLYTHE